MSRFIFALFVGLFQGGLAYYLATRIHTEPPMAFAAYATLGILAVGLAPKGEL